MGKWYPHDSAFDYPLDVDDLVRGAGLVQLCDFAKHPGTCEWIHADGMWFVRFSDGNVGGPLGALRQHIYGNTFVDRKALLKAGILTQDHMDEIAAERGVHRLKKESEERESKRYKLYSDAVKRQTDAVHKERDQLVVMMRIGIGVGILGDEKLLEGQRRIRELDTEIKHIETLPLEQLLSPEELTSYLALEPTPEPR
jgi:hypothetical protein